MNETNSIFELLEALEVEIINPTGKLLSKAKALINALSEKERTENPKILKCAKALLGGIQATNRKPLPANNNSQLNYCHSTMSAIQAL